MKATFTAATMVVLMFVCVNFESSAQTASPLANPILYMTSQEFYSANGSNFIRYRYGVLNSSAYPDAMFAAAPGLPPCGTNMNSARTWVDFFDQSGKRLYGFCALGKSDHLNSIFFAVPEGSLPPSWVYIELNDRQTGTKYKSNLAETTL